MSTFSFVPASSDIFELVVDSNALLSIICSQLTPDEFKSVESNFSFKSSFSCFKQPTHKTTFSIYSFLLTDKGKDCVYNWLKKKLYYIKFPGEKEGRPEFSNWMEKLTIEESCLDEMAFIEMAAFLTNLKEYELLDFFDLFGMSIIADIFNDDIEERTADFEKCYWFILYLAAYQEFKSSDYFVKFSNSMFTLCKPIKRPIVSPATEISENQIPDDLLNVIAMITQPSFDNIEIFDSKNDISDPETALYDRVVCLSRILGICRAQIEFQMYSLKVQTLTFSNFQKIFLEIFNSLDGIEKIRVLDERNENISSCTIV